MKNVTVSNSELMDPETFGRKIATLLTGTSTQGGQLTITVKEWVDDGIIRTGGALGNAPPPGSSVPKNNF